MKRKSLRDYASRPRFPLEKNLWTAVKCPPTPENAPELHIFVAYGVFFGVFVLVVGFWGGGFGSLIGGGVFG
ncbi:hypothetical protein [Mobiluncus mulieris]|uniref:hypothetical protein n=1 Tax=Mobiluncus mulieris TaxID=2052 RepID=UPI0021E2809A|nr:hypothetical protein [Mobiluncus mulieris]